MQCVWNSMEKGKRGRRREEISLSWHVFLTHPALFFCEFGVVIKSWQRAWIFFYFNFIFLASTPFTVYRNEGKSHLFLS